MPGTDPTLISGYVSGYDFNAQTSSASNGASVTTLGSYAVPTGHTAPTMAATAANGRKALAFSGANALYQDLASSQSAGTVIMVASASDLSGGSYPQDRRVLLGTTKTTAGSSGHWALWPFKQSTLAFNNGGGGEYRYLTDGYARFQLDKFFLSSFSWNAATGLGKSWKNYTLDGSFYVGSGSTPAGSAFAFNSLCVGADRRIYADTGTVSRAWSGYVARIVVFNTVLSDADREAATAYLIDYYGIDEFDILVDGKTSPSGHHVELTLTDTDGDAANVISVTGSFTYELNSNGSRLTATPYYSSWQDFNGIALEMPSALSASDAVTVTIPAGAISTNIGPCEARTVTVTNRVGTRRISQSLPSSRTLKLGFNFPGPAAGQNWTSTYYVSDLIKGCSPESGTGLTWDSLGRPTNAYAGLKFLISSPGDASIPGLVYPRLPNGTYTGQWDPAGPGFELVAHPGPPTTTITAGSTTTVGGKTRKTWTVTGAGASPCFSAQVTGSTGTPTDWHLWPPGVDPDDPGVVHPRIVEKFAGSTVVRFLDLYPMNFANIAQAGAMTPMSYFSYGYQYDSARRLSIDIARIDAWTGTAYVPSNSRQFFKVTTTSAHGLVDGQGGVIRSTGGLVSVKLTGEETFPLTGVGTGNVVVLSPTEFFFAAYTGTPNKGQVSPYLGTTAYLEVALESFAPPEVMAHIANEITGCTTCWVNVPVMATEGLVREIAQKVCDTLDSGIRIRFEYGNECWNPGFPALGHCSQMAVKYNLAAPGALRPGIGYGYLAPQAWAWFKDECLEQGRSAADLEFALGLWYGSPAFTEDVITGLALASATDQPTHAAFAPYTLENPAMRFGIDWSKSQYSLEVMMDFHEWRIDAADTCPLYEDHRALLEAAGMTLRFVNYEDNSAYLGFSQDAPGYSTESTESITLALHPRMRGYWYKRWQDQQAHGVDESAIYTGPGNFGTERYGYGYTAYPFLTGGEQPVGPGDGSLGGGDNRALMTAVTGKPTLSGWDLTEAEAVRLWAVQQWNSGATPPVTAVWSEVSTPRSGSISSITLTFSEPVTGFDIGDVSLELDGDPIDVSALTPITVDDQAHTLTSLSSLTDEPGTYEIRLVSSGSGITGDSGGTLAADAVRTWTVTAPVSDAVPLGPLRERLRVTLRP